MNLSELLKKSPQNWTQAERRMLITHVSTMQNSDLNLGDIVGIGHGVYHLLQTGISTLNGIVPRLAEITELAIGNIEEDGSLLSNPELQDLQAHLYFYAANFHKVNFEFTKSLGFAEGWYWHNVEHANLTRHTNPELAASSYNSSGGAAFIIHNNYLHRREYDLAAYWATSGVLCYHEFISSNESQPNIRNHETLEIARQNTKKLIDFLHKHPYT